MDHASTGLDWFKGVSVGRRVLGLAVRVGVVGALIIRIGCLVVFGNDERNRIMSQVLSLQLKVWNPGLRKQ